MNSLRRWTLRATQRSRTSWGSWRRTRLERRLLKAETLRQQAEQEVATLQVRLELLGLTQQEQLRRLRPEVLPTPEPQLPPTEPPWPEAIPPLPLLTAPRREMPVQPQQLDQELLSRLDGQSTLQPSHPSSES